MQAFPVQESNIRSDGGRGDFITIAGRQQDHKLLSSFNASWSSLGQPQFEVRPWHVPRLYFLSSFQFVCAKTRWDNPFFAKDVVLLVHFLFLG